MPFTIVRQDITKMETDAIVNAANTHLLMGGGVCGAIFNAAGAREMQAACDKLSPIATGQAAITPGFALKAKYVIHAAGPVYRRDNVKESERLLKSAYTQSLLLAYENNCESVAFPLISSGIYGYPKKDALRAATAAILDYLKDREMDVYLAVFDKDSLEVSEALQGAVESYIDENYIAPRSFRRRELLDVEADALSDASITFYNAPMEALSNANFEDIVGNLDEPFSATLLRLIDSKGMTDSQVYKRANIDRKLFSKIRVGKGYMPGKKTILALCVALKLTLLETNRLLGCAGYALSHSVMFDVIVEYFIINELYDIFKINELLFKYDQPLLGG